VRCCALLFALGFCLAAAAPIEHNAITSFSTMPPGDVLPTGWRKVMLPRVKHAEVILAADAGGAVLRVRSEDAAGSAAYPLREAVAPRATLAWRWKIDRVVEKANLETRRGDDFAARVYVFFDVPLESLPWGERLKLRLARLLHGEDLPVAGLCYVWDNRHAIGVIRPNPYAPRIRTFVLESGVEAAGQWVTERRDLDRDFIAAFGAQPSGVPRVTGIAAGNDTDQTGESVVAWFGDFQLTGAR
jgi:hypothetical protein